ncbi:MAG: hypothetical protein JSS75_06395 [Bacteroidetes bacterium]|nr:hypothetical protein [Bacteroidota bacterium]
MFTHDMNDRNKWMKVPMAILFGALAVGVFGWVAMSLWNFTVPDLFHGPVLSYWQAVALLILSKIFFGGFHGRHRHRGGHHGPQCGSDTMPNDLHNESDKKEWSRYLLRMMWMKQMHKIYWMKHLTPQERENLTEEWKRGWTEPYKPWEDMPGDWLNQSEKEEWSRYVLRMLWLKQMHKIYWMKNLTPEQREQMREEWKRNWTEDFKPWEEETKPNP